MSLWRLHDDMKKLFLSIFLVFGIIIMATAAPVFKSLDNFSGKTTVIVEVDSVSAMPNLQDVVFHNSGKAYECKELKTTLTGEKLTISAGFKKFKTFENCYLTFMLDGQMQKVEIVCE